MRKLDLISCTLQNLYSDNCLSKFIIYGIGITVFPIVYVLGW